MRATLVLSALLALVQVHHVAVASSSTEYPLVSITIPTYQRREYVLKAMELIDRQDYPNLEVIIVDDSPQPSLADADLAALTAPGRKIPVVYKFLKNRLSIGMKRNIAVGTARGEIIVHWDDDDWYAADRVTIQVAPIIAGRADLTMLPHHTVYMLMEDQYYQLVSKGYWGAHFGTLVYRRAIWSSGLEFGDNSLGEDYSFAESTALGGAKVDVLTTVVDKHVYVRHARNTWQFDLDEFKEQVIAVPAPRFMRQEDILFYQQARQRALERKDQDTFSAPPALFTSPSIRWDVSAINVPGHEADEELDSADQELQTGGKGRDEGDEDDPDFDQDEDDEEARRGRKRRCKKKRCNPCHRTSPGYPCFCVCHPNHPLYKRMCKKSCEGHPSYRASFCPGNPGKRKGQDRSVLTTPAVAGGVGATVGIAGLAVIAFFVLRRRWNTRSSHVAAAPMTTRTGDVQLNEMDPTASSSTADLTLAPQLQHSSSSDEGAQESLPL